MSANQHVRQWVPETASAKWNAVVINVINYTCAFPAATRPNVCREKPLEYSVSVVAEGPAAPFSTLNSAVNLTSSAHVVVSRCRTLSVQNKQTKDKNNRKAVSVRLAHHRPDIQILTSLL